MVAMLRGYQYQTKPFWGLRMCHCMHTYYILHCDWTLSVDAQFLHHSLIAGERASVALQPKCALSNPGVRISDCFAQYTQYGLCSETSLSTLARTSRDRFTKQWSGCNRQWGMRLSGQHLSGMVNGIGALATWHEPEWPDIIAIATVVTINKTPVVINHQKLHTACISWYFTPEGGSSLQCLVVEFFTGLLWVDKPLV